MISASSAHASASSAVKCFSFYCSYSFDDAFAEQPLRPHQQKGERQHIGEPVLDRAQRPSDRGALKEYGERGDQRAGHRGGDEIELIDQNAGDDQRLLWDADVERMDVAAPDELAEAVEEEGEADRRHEQDDRLLV